jgi:hypothetical protein
MAEPPAATSVEMMARSPPKKAPARKKVAAKKAPPKKKVVVQKKKKVVRRAAVGGIEKVRFPVEGGPGRAAAGQAGAPFLFAGLLPTLLELSRVSQLPAGGFGMGAGP